MLGGVLASLGMVAGSFCRTLSQLYIAAGFISGECHSISRITEHLLKSAGHWGTRQAKRLGLLV